MYSNKSENDPLWNRNTSESNMFSYASGNSKAINEENDNKWYNRWCLIPTRYIIAIWGFLGFTVVYALRVNLSVAMIAMVNRSAIAPLNTSAQAECNYPKVNSTPTPDGEFVWNQEIQGIILGAFFWGYIPLQIPAGWLAVKVGGKWLFGFGVLWTSVLTLLTPVAANAGYGWLIALRVLEGAGESITYPGMHTMIGFWAPVMEITFIGAIIYSGSFFGLVSGLIGSGWLINANIMGGWPSVFYIEGLIGVVWFVIWVFVAYSTPAQHPRIRSTERLFIESSIELSSEKFRKVPWKAIFLSMPVWAISVANFSSMWSLYTLLTSLPQYFEYILDFSIDENSYLNALPYFLSMVAFILSGKAADLMRQRQCISATATRKLFNTIGMLVNAAFIIGISYVGCDRVLVVVFLCLAVAIGTTNTAGYNVNHIDLAPQYGGVLYGLSNSIATISGIVGPYVVGALTNYQETRKQWQIVFYLSSAITLFGAVFYLIFGTAERQPWAIETPEFEIKDDEDS